VPSQHCVGSPTSSSTKKQLQAVHQSPKLFFRPLLISLQINHNIKTVKALYSNGMLKLATGSLGAGQLPPQAAAAQSDSDKWSVATSAQN
jgi:hypothetical protein